MFVQQACHKPWADLGPLTAWTHVNQFILSGSINLLVIEACVNLLITWMCLDLLIAQTCPDLLILWVTWLSHSSHEPLIRSFSDCLWQVSWFTCSSEDVSIHSSHKNILIHPFGECFNSICHIEFVDSLIAQKYLDTLIRRVFILTRLSIHSSHKYILIYLFGECFDWPVCHTEMCWFTHPMNVSWSAHSTSVSIEPLATRTWLDLLTARTCLDPLILWVA